MMESIKIVYTSSLCSEKVENLILDYNPSGIGLQIQKYHRLLVYGLTDNGVDVAALSFHSGMQKINVPSTESYNRLVYRYIISNKCSATINRIFVIGKSFCYAWNLLKTSDKSGVVCDVLNFSVSLGAIIAARILGKPALGIITDFPEHLAGNNRFNTNLIWKLIHLCSGYVILTDQMREKLSANKKALVLEGHVDHKMATTENLLKNKDQRIVCIYAGALHRKYGIEALVKAFIKADVENSVLYVYGDGDYAEELKILQCDRVVYHGIVPNRVVVEMELKATLLINPRPTNEEFTKYSFPSKNMEYMVSGTPVLTTKLPGMPKEYYDYVYLFEDETIDGMAATLTRILNIDRNELHKRGLEAKRFVLEKKNNIIQAKNILEELIK